MYSLVDSSPPPSLSVSSRIPVAISQCLICQPLAELVKINGIVQLEILPRLEDFTKLVEVTRTAAATDKVTDK